MFTKKDLQRLIFPLVIEQILVMLVGIADTVMVSYAGEAAISGVSLVDMINYLFITVFAAIATGGAVVVAQYLGSGEPAAASRSASQLYMLAGAISLVCAAMCLAFHRGILAGDVRIHRARRDGGGGAVLRHHVAVLPVFGRL